MLIAKVQGGVLGAWPVVTGASVISEKQSYDHALTVHRDACKAGCFPSLAEPCHASTVIAVPRGTSVLPAPAGDTLHEALHFLVKLRGRPSFGGLRRCVAVAFLEQHV